MNNSKLGSNEHPALHALSRPQNELLAVRHPAPKKLISLRGHKVSEATIENLCLLTTQWQGGHFLHQELQWRVWGKFGGPSLELFSKSLAFKGTWLAGKSCHVCTFYLLYFKATCECTPRCQDVYQGNPCKMESGLGKCTICSPNDNHIISYHIS